MSSDGGNDLHDIKAGIAYSDLEDIDVDMSFGVTDEDIARQIRSIGERASIGQLRQVLGIGIHGEDLARERLVDKFVARKLSAVLRVRKAIEETGM